MKNSKISRFFGRGRKWVFTLALFLLVFAAASAVKVQALGNVTGNLWGGSEDKNLGGNYDIWPPDGNETGVGEIRMSGTATDIAKSEYGVNIPSSDGPITGGNNFAWSETLGWIDFDGVAVTTVGNERRLSGQARIIAIRDAGANAGGWQGWIKMSGDGANGNGLGASCVPGNNNYKNTNECNYGVKIDSKTGQFSGYGWNGEEGLTVTATQKNTANGLGWIDFSQAKVKTCPSITCSTKTPCAGVSLGTTGSACDGLSFCGSEDAICTLTSGTTWICSDGCGTTLPECSASVQPKVDGACNSSIDGKTICDNSSPSLCTSGTPSISYPDWGSIYETTWACGGTCGGATDSCSAKGKKSCGWIETNP